MLLLDFEENDGKQARFFQVNLIEGSVAWNWYNSGLVSPEAKKSWSLLLPLLKQRFDNSLEDRHNAFVHISTSKLADTQIGVKGPDGEYEHVTWARKLAVASQGAGQDPDNNNAFLVLNNLGPQIRNLVSSTGCSSSVSRICQKIEGLSSMEITAIKDAVEKESENAKMRAQIAMLQRQILRSPSEMTPQIYTPPTAYQQPSGQENRAPQSLGPFPQTTEGMDAYKRAVADFYKAWGANSFASLSRPFPLSPGTDEAGSNECFKCGKADHLRAQCTASYTLPENEQRYRGSVMKQKRERGNVSTTTNAMPLGKPIRYMHLDHDEHFSHLNHLPVPQFNHQRYPGMQSLPLSPALTVSDLPEDCMSGNGGDLYQ
ncbi:hypothetical protein FFLO_05813 [Filobasidium floriforme]|uniref:CCHC-type domain-containing protein n=1 Tax=Filobasidium floriforme TaxID=5210 RepID=A0A8K0NNG9_9TREE|nr:hypothetical protein FFLO_05813 [Filobasidium floriforme]